MSIEKNLADLTAAVVALTEVVQAQTTLIQTGTAKAAAKTEAAAPKTEAAATKTEAAAPKADKPKAAAKAKPVTEEALREKFGGYLTSSTDKAEKRRLTATVKPILEHFGVERVTEIAEESRAEAIGYADLLIAGYEEGGIEGAEGVRLPFMSEDEGDGDEEGGDEGVL